MTDERTALTAALRSLDGPAFAAFVADLWTARGRNVEREGETLVATHQGERTVLAPVAASRVPDRLRSVPAGADTVVTPAADAPFAPEGVTVVAGDDLVSMLRYAVDPETAVELCETHLGAPPAELGVPLGVRARRAVAGVRPERAGVAVALVAAVAMLALALPAASLTDTGTSSSDGTTAANASEAVQERVAPTQTIRPTTTASLPVDAYYNVATLTVEHRAALAAHPYAVTQTVVLADGERNHPRIGTRSVRQVGERFVLTERDIGDMGVPNRQLYYNGFDTYVATYRNGSRVYDRMEGRPFDPRNRTVERLRRYLAVEEYEVVNATVEHGVRRVHVVGEGTPPTINGTNYQVDLFVQQGGFIRWVDVEYERPDGVTVSVTWNYRRITGEDLNAPAWYGNKLRAGAD